MSLDFAYIADQLVRGGVASFLTVPGLAGEVTKFVNDPNPDYFEGGKAFGKIWKNIFDMNLAN